MGFGIDAVEDKEAIGAGRPLVEITFESGTGPEVEGASLMDSSVAILLAVRLIRLLLRGTFALFRIFTEEGVTRLEVGGPLVAEPSKDVDPRVLLLCLAARKVEGVLVTFGILLASLRGLGMVSKVCRIFLAVELMPPREESLLGLFDSAEERLEWPGVRWWFTCRTFTFVTEGILYGVAKYGCLVEELAPPN